jgi:type IV secretory pathway VirB10-like protein
MSAIEPPSDKAPPDSLAIRARPRPVTRLSRKALAGILGVSAVLILGGTLWALRTPARKAASDELYSTDRKATAEGLNTLPKDYASLGAGVPKLGPPLPGDLGRPILGAEQAGRLPAGAVPAMGAANAPAGAADEVRQQQIKATQDAIGSGLFSVSDVRGALGGAGGGAPAADLGALTQALTGPIAGAAPTATPAAGSLTASRHEAFANATSDQATVSAHRLEAPVSPYTVMAGTVIAAALVTGLDSDLPGQVIATVTAPVFDSVTGHTLLIPQGSRLLGTYDSQVAFGESRAMVVWTRLILPDGRSVVLDRLPGADAQGYAGVADTVDNHWGRLIGGAVLTSALGVGAELASPETQTTGNNGEIVIATRNGVQDTVNQVGQELTRRNLDIKPTIKVRPGFPLRVLVSKDLVLESYGRAGG